MISKLAIGDIGSTTGSWAVLEDGAVRTFNTTGYNPSLHDDSVRERFLHQLSEELHEPGEIYYYGSGITGRTKAEETSNAISSIYSSAKIEVYSDLLGAARATCKSGTGIVAILGTGSNCGYYDGRTITRQATNLGYPLGDEGSGWRLGAMLLRKYYYSSMPDHLAEAFAQQVPDSRKELLEYLRISPFPNRYLASFATFAAGLKTDPWIAKMVDSCFEEFIEIHLQKMERDLPVHFVGGIAFGFRENLVSMLSKYGYTAGTIADNALHGLIEFHRDNI